MTRHKQSINSDLNLQERELQEIKKIFNFQYVAHDSQYVVGYVLSYDEALAVMDRFSCLFSFGFTNEYVRPKQFGKRGW